MLGRDGLDTASADSTSRAGQAAHIGGGSAIASPPQNQQRVQRHSSKKIIEVGGCGPTSTAGMSSAEDGVAPAVGMGGNSVVSLVQQLKAGKLTKEELFDQLSRIQKAKRGGPADSLPPGGAPHPPGEDGFQSPNAGASTDSGRAMPDNREAYRSGSGSQVAARADPGAERRQREEEELIRRAKLQYGASKQQSPERATHFPMSGNGFASGPEQEDSFDYEGAASQSAAGGARRDVRQYSTPQKSVRTVSARPQSADSAALRRKGPRASSPGQARRAASPRPSSPGPWKGGAGSARKAQEFEFATAKRGLDDRALERMRQIEQERQANYTFRPQLYRGAGPDYISSRTAASASGKGSDLYERSLAWQRRRDQQREEEKLRLEREREKECTFQPKVTREGAVQLHAALGYVHHAPSSSLHTRARPESPAARRAGVDPEATTERLYKQGLQHKKHLQEKLRQRLQEEMQQMCTFKPAVNPEGRVRDPTPVRARCVSLPRSPCVCWCRVGPSQYRYTSTRTKARACSIAQSDVIPTAHQHTYQRVHTAQVHGGDITEKRVGCGLSDSSGGAGLTGMHFQTGSAGTEQRHARGARIPQRTRLAPPVQAASGYSAGEQ